MMRTYLFLLHRFPFEISFNATDQSSADRKVCCQWAALAMGTFAKYQTYLARLTCHLRLKLQVDLDSVHLCKLSQELAHRKTANSEQDQAQVELACKHSGGTERQFGLASGSPIWPVPHAYGSHACNIKWECSGVANRFDVPDPRLNIF